MPENRQLKQDLIVDLDGKLPEETIIASNSSSYTINEIIKGAQIRHPERAVSMHSCLLPRFVVEALANLRYRLAS